jgi:predicted phage-related endonuclease
MDEIARWGLLLEPVILAEFCRQSGVKAEQLPPITVHRDPERNYLHATLDAQADDGSPVELKTAHFAQAKIWKNEVPLPYMVQVQHQIHVTGAKCGYIAVLKDGYEFAWHRVERHQKFIDRLLKRLDRFWGRYVKGREPPPTDFSRATADALARQYPASNGNCIELPAELESLVAEYDELTAAESAATKRKDEIKNLLKSKIGENQYGTFISGNGFQWAGKDGKRTFRRAKRCPEPTSAA